MMVTIRMYLNRELLRTVLIASDVQLTPGGEPYLKSLYCTDTTELTESEKQKAGELVLAKFAADVLANIGGARA